MFRSFKVWEVWETKHQCFVTFKFQSSVFLISQRRIAQTNKHYVFNSILTNMIYKVSSCSVHSEWDLNFKPGAIIVLNVLSMLIFIPYTKQNKKKKRKEKKNTWIFGVLSVTHTWYTCKHKSKLDCYNKILSNFW